MEILNLVAGKLDLFLLILARVSGIFTTAPFFAGRTIPVQLKAGLSGIIALILLPVVPAKEMVFAPNMYSFSFMLVGELATGLLIGFVAGMVFAGILLAGELLDMQVGFSMVNIIDPMFGTPIPLIGNFKHTIALLVFLSTNSHHYLLQALMQSFHTTTVGTVMLNVSMFEYLIGLASTIFLTAVKLAIPVVGCILVIEVAMGLLARTVPQMNVFVVGIPLKILVGLFMIIVTLPLYTLLLETLFKHNFQDMLKLNQLM